MKATALVALVALCALPLPALADTTAELDPAHSSASFSVRHLTLTKVYGTIQIKDAKIVIGDDSALKEADATLDLKTIDTHQPQRDADLQSERWFNVATYPFMTFKSTKIEPGAAGTFRITGDLSCRGVTKPVTLDAMLSGTVKDGHGRTHVGYSASATIDRTQYGLGASFPPLVVGNDVTIDIEVDAIEG